MHDASSAIPVYALYGEDSRAPFADRLHWETLESRSRLYGFRIAPHRHEQLFQLLHLTGGTAEVELDGRAVRVRPPALIVVPALSVHGFAFSEDIDGGVLTLFDRDVEAGFAAMAGAAAQLRQPLVLADGAAVAVVGEAIAALVAEAGRGGETQELAVRARIELLLVALVRAVGASEAAPVAAPGRALAHARRFRQLVEAEYRAHRPIAYYAGALGITAPHLNRIARDILGLSALAVIEARLLLEAKRYLMFSGLTVKQVAGALGYADPAYFCRVFRRGTGQTPSEFRQKLGDDGGGTAG